MPFLRQSTAQTIRFGPCLDKTDGVTEEIGLTLAQADMRLSKDGGAFAQKSAAGNATHDSDGWYSTALSTTDTDTVGELILNVHQPANMLPVWLRWWVLEEKVYDDLFGAAATGMRGTDSVDTAAMRGTDSAALAAVCTEARLAELDAANLPSTADDILVDTAVIGALGAGLTDLGGMSTGMKGEVNAECDTALTDYNAVIQADLGYPQKNQAFSNIAFLLVDSTDHVTPETGLTPTGERSIDGGAFAAVSGVIAEVGSGVYQFDALAADMNGGTIVFRFLDAAVDDSFIFIKTRA